MQPATPQHAAALALIHAEAFRPAARWGADAMALQLAAPGAFGWIDARGGLVLARVAADEAEILTLAVLPEARRTGLGTALLTRAMATARERGAASMVLEVDVGNAPAVALYRRAGFAEVARRPAYYGAGHDARVMRAALSLIDHAF